MVNKMGIETIAILGLTLLQAHSSIGAAEDEAQGVVDQANIDAENKGKETRLLAARQQASFLNSGLTLEGTPMAAIQNTFSVGLEDINQITTNANKKSKNIISSARSEAIGSLVSAGSGAAFGGGDIFGGASGSGFLGSQGTVSRGIEFGNTSAQGPIQGFGGFGG